MSLLMKALEKAAKDRGEARADSSPAAAPPAAPAPEPKRELALEPVASPASAPANASRHAESQPMRPSAPPAAAASTTRATARPRDAAQAHAGTVLQAQAASRTAGAGIGDYVRGHPILVFGTLAGLFAIGFGVYVYLQIFHPALFVPRPPVTANPPLPPLTQAPAVTPPSPAPAPLLPSAPLLKEAAEAEPVRPAAATVEPPRPKPAPKRRAARTEDAPRSMIAISAGSAEPVLNPLHGQAYAALQAGRSDEARRLYGELAKAEPRNVQPLLGLAALAARDGDVDEAIGHFLSVLKLEPRNALAQSGLIALLGRADPLAAETRLKQLIAREPSAHLHFTLGNLYADQSQWAAAQQSYFRAHHLEPGNPDYAYNLAVALDHVSQPALALRFYRSALELAEKRGRANFSAAQARDRVAILAQRAE